MNTLQPAIHSRDSALMLMEAVRDNYTFHVRAFTRWVRASGRELDYQAVHDYIVELNNTDYSANTKRIKRQAVKSRIRSMARGLELEDQAKMETALKNLDRDFDTRAPKVNSTAITRDMCLTVQEVQDLILKCRTKRQVAFIRFLFNTGCRVSEMCGIKIGHCRREGGKVSIRVTGKGRKERWVKIAEGLYDKIQETFGGEEYLFETEGGKPYHRCYVSDQIKKIGKRIGKRISAHTLRHSRISSWVQGHPGSLDAISKYVGHSNVSITLEMYCHAEMSEEMLFEEGI